MREAKVEEFINLKQGSMTVREYSLKFVKLSRYATSLVSNSRDEISRFLTGVAEDLEEECRTAMLHDNMDHKSGKVHVVMQHSFPTLFFEIFSNSCQESTHLVSAVRHKRISIP